MTKPQVCSKCVMDTTDRDIQFDESGVCNHCRKADGLLPSFSFSEKEEQENLQSIREQILSRKKGKYDCMVGVSGGVDSTYVAYLLVKKLGLNPLAVHMDNGWNSEIAVSNIHNLVNALNIDLETYVIDWREFRDLQRAFIHAGVVDVELLTDQAHKAVAVKLAGMHRIRTNITGGNYVTEHGMPRSWYWGYKQDVSNIKSIYKSFPGKPLKTYPFLSTLKHRYYQKTGNGLLSIPVLNSINYAKVEAIEAIREEVGWVDYGGKHNESVWTKFYQEYYLPKRFDIDKRKVHYSALIRTNDMSRAEALENLSVRPYSDQEEVEFVEYVIKKLGFTKLEFEELLSMPRVEHDQFASDIKILNRLRSLKNLVRP